MTTYPVIYLDPPWHYNSRANHKTRFRGGVHGHYPTMTMDEIKALPVPDLAARTAAVFMWCTYPYLDEQIKLFKHWGFRYRTIAFNWTKLNAKGYWTPHADPNYSPEKQYVKYGELWHSIFFGVGYYAKSNTEPCLMAMRGQLPTLDNTVSSVILAPRREHSRKPDEARERIVRLFGDVPRLEMFARQKADGWHSWGNTVPNDIEIGAAA